MEPFLEKALPVEKGSTDVTNNLPTKLSNDLKRLIEKLGIQALDLTKVDDIETWWDLRRYIIFELNSIMNLPSWMLVEQLFSCLSWASCSGVEWSLHCFVLCLASCVIQASFVKTCFESSR